MIIKGRAVRSVSHWSRYLREQGENEKVTKHEIRASSQDLKEALEEWRETAKHTHSKGNFMYHASFNPKADEKLTHEQWMKAIDLVEEKMGFQGHQRVIYEHVKEGRQHFHVLWNRADPKTRTIADIQGDRYTLRHISNELERDYGLTPTKPVRDFDDPRPYQEWQGKEHQTKRAGREALKGELKELWHKTDTGEAFITAAEERGYVIAQGDRREFLIVDHNGDPHSLPRRLGVKTAEVRKRFADIDEDSLPGVAEAREDQRHRLMEQGGSYDRDAAGQAWEARLEAAMIAGEMAKDERRKEALLHPVFDRDAQDRDWHTRMEDAAMAHAAASHKAELEAMAALGPPTPMEKTINRLLEKRPDPKDFMDVLEAKHLTVAYATDEGIGQYKQEIHQRNLEAERAWRYASIHDENIPCPTPREMPELKPGELVIVSKRGGVHKLDDKRVDHAALAERAEAGRGFIPPLDAVRDDIKLRKDIEAQSRAGRREAYLDSRAEAKALSHERSLDASEQRELHAPVKDRAWKNSGSGLRVLNGATNILSGLVEFLAGVSNPSPKRMTRAEESLAERRSERALDNMQRDLDRGQPFRDQDINALTHQHKHQIREQGDAYVRNLLAQRDRARQRTLGNERER